MTENGEILGGTKESSNKEVSFASKLKSSLAKAGFAVAVSAGLAVGFFSGKMYDSYLNKINEKKYKAPINCKDISIAINERNELLIIDRVSGEYKTYQDSVGRGIFDMYSKIVFLNKTNDK